MKDNSKVKLIFLLLIMLQNVFSFSQTYNIITFNIRYNNARDSMNAWGNRKDAFFAQVKSKQPDIICFQEVLHDQLIDLKNNLPGFDFVGEGRDGDTLGEYSPVFFNKQKFEMLNWKTRWLGPDSMAKGKLAWDAACTRIYTLTNLKDKKSGEEFTIINTHFDHIGDTARQHSAEIILDQIKKHESRNIIFTGDLNCTPGSKAVQKFINSKLLSMAGATDTTSTCCGFEPTDTHNKRIDYIFFTAEFTSTNYTILNKKDRGHFLSDHHGVFCKLAKKK